MESKLLRGSTNILDHTNEQQKALAARANEIRERKVNNELFAVPIPRELYFHHFNF